MIESSPFSGKDTPSRGRPSFVSLMNKSVLAVSLALSAGASYANEDWQLLKPSQNCRNLGDLPKIKNPPSSDTPQRIDSVIASVKTFLTRVPPSSQTYHIYPVIIRSSKEPEDIRQLEIYRENKDGKGKGATPVPHWPGKYISTNACDTHVYIKPNGLNSPIVVIDNGGNPWDILAWNAHYDTKAPKRHPYSPVTDMMKNPDLIEIGKKRLKGYLDETDDWLREKGIKITYGSKNVLLADVTTKRLIHTLIVIEKMDPLAYMGDDISLWREIMDEQILKIYGRLGANQGDAWMSQKNEFGACGIAQYTPLSWATASNRFPVFGLGKHEPNCTDHSLSLRAMYGHIDMELEEFYKKPNVYSWITGDGARYFPIVLAMGYNMNAKKLANIIESALVLGDKSGERIFSSIITQLPRRDPKLEAETLTYIFKFLYFSKQLGISEPWMEKLSGEVFTRIIYERAHPLPVSPKKQSPKKKKKL